MSAVICSEASGEEHPFVEYPEDSRESNFNYLFEKIFTVDPLFNKQND